MSRTLLSGRTGRVLNGPSGNWECPILGRVSALMGTKYHTPSIILKGEEEPWWLSCSQPYELDGEECWKFADPLVNVTDEVIATIKPFTRTFIGTEKELKETVIYWGRYYRRLRDGCKSAS